MNKSKDNEKFEAEDIPEVIDEKVSGGSGAENPDLTDLLKKLQEYKDKAQAEAQRADDMTNVATRLRADFDNYRKRMNESNAREKNNGKIEVLEKIIPVLDVVDQALGMIKDQSVIVGVEMIKSQLGALLTSCGISEIDSTGQFDPKVHEAIMRVPCESDEQAGMIKEVFQKGYIMGDRLIRPARVIVYND